MSLLAMSRSAVLASKDTMGQTLKQMGKSLDHNTQLQKAVNTGSTKEVEVTSALTNPFKVHEGEKYDFMEKVRDRIRSIYKYSSDTVIDDITSSGLDQLKTKGGFTNASVFLEGSSSLIGVVMMKLGQLKSFGWELSRLTEGSTLTAKTISQHAGSTIKREAPFITDTSSVSVKYSHADYHVGELKTVVVQDEIHRVADAFGLDAQYLTALLKAAATIHANGKIELATGTDLVASAENKAEVRAGVEIRHSAPLHIFTDGANGTITMQDGIINFNPTQSETMAAHVQVAEVEVITPNSFARAMETGGQYEGVLGHDTFVV